VEAFLHKHAESVSGVLSGFDRLIIRGTLRRLAYVRGLMSYLAGRHVWLKQFAAFVQEATTRTKEASLAVAQAAQRPVIYLESSATSKEAVARQIAERDGITTGLICVLSVVEPCRTYDVQRDPARRQLEVVIRRRKCLHLYHYLIHPVFGFMHARLQTWLPFNVQIGLNGREWLSRQLDAAGLGYTRRENCFAWLADPARTQQLAAAQLQLDWPGTLNRIAHQINPAARHLFAHPPVPYYWSVYQSEWATDILFRDRASLARLYPQLLHQGITTFQSADVMRFLGRKVPAHGGVNGQFAGEVITDLVRRPEGVRLKHRVARHGGWLGNSLKLYDKQGTVLRTETTINEPTDFRVFRPAEGTRSRTKAWRPLRRGIADLHRRAEVSHAANARYLTALAVVDTPTRVGDLAAPLCRPVTWKDHRVRALNPWAPADAALLAAVSRGEFMLNGLRNRDLCALLYPSPTTRQQRRRHSAAVTRQLRLLRAHRVVRKVPKAHRYLLTDTGRAALAALRAAQLANADALTKQAA
jgi:hypothetical protein